MAFTVVVGTIVSHGGYIDQDNSGNRRYAKLYLNVVFEPDDGSGTIIVDRINVTHPVDPVMFPGTNGRFVIQKTLFMKFLLAAEVGSTFYGSLSKEKKQRFGFSAKEPRRL